MAHVQSLRHGAPAAALGSHALFLDIDGTLLELALTPDGVEVPASLVSMLQRLSISLDGAIAFVSGRTIAAIDRLFNPLVLPAVGVHGSEIRTHGAALPADERLSTALQAVVPALQQAVGQIRGVQLENKGSAVALHYRGAPERGRDVLQLAEKSVAHLGGEFGALLGKCVVEIRPRHLTKGTAIERLMTEAPFRGRTPIFAGDDRTDEDAFEVVNRLGGISVHIGDNAASVAKYRLADPDALRAWLQQLADD
jgi:trehalose 6-phosphate phosphatase